MLTTSGYETFHSINIVSYRNTGKQKQAGDTL